MPIDKEKLEKDAIKRVEEFLRKNPDNAYTLEELESELDFTKDEKIILTTPSASYIK